jgi:hypothetical protein
MNEKEEHNSQDSTILAERNAVNYILRYICIDGKNDNDQVIGIGDFTQLKPCCNPVLEQTDKRCTSKRLK